MKKKMLCILLLLGLTLSGCSSHDTKCMELILEPRTYSAEEISAVFGGIKEEFPETFRNARLLSLVYSEDIQTHVEQEKLPEGEVMVVSVSIYGKHRNTSQDRADYYCVLNRINDRWEIHDWRLNRNPGRFFEKEKP